jgi:hypothetical protein
MSKQNTITEMDEKVKEGLRIAREAIDDAALLKLCDDLEYAWQNLCSNLLIVAVGLSGMKYRNADQIKAQLQQYLLSIQSAKSMQMNQFVPDTTLPN